MSTTTVKKPAPKTSTRKPAAKPTPATTKATTPKEQTKAVPKPKASKPEPKTLIEALTTGQAVLVKIRANKTVRSLPYLAPGGDQRKEAEAVAARVGKGETLSAIAEDLKVSLATARRFLTNLSLAHDVEAGKHDEAWTKGTKQVVVHTVTAKA
jgi:hypothetical protein